MANEKRLIDYQKATEIALDTLRGKITTVTAVMLVSKLKYATVDAVEVVHGRWVMKETMIRSPFAKNAYCSVCLEETNYAYNYCPNCGAKMDGGNEDG
jgi:hypothetical protein